MYMYVYKGILLLFFIFGQKIPTSQLCAQISEELGGKYMHRTGDCSIFTHLSTKNRCNCLSPPSSSAFKCNSVMTK